MTSDWRNLNWMRGQETGHQGDFFFPLGFGIRLYFTDKTLSIHSFTKLVAVYTFDV